MEIREAIEKKLKSSLALKEKCILARNVFLAPSEMIKFPMKEQMILEWVSSVISKKFSQRSNPDEDEELWQLMLKLVESPKFESNFLMATKETFWDVLNSIADHVGEYIVKDSAEKWMKIFIRRHRLVRSELMRNPDLLNHFSAKCLENRFAIEDILWMCNCALIQNGGKIIGSNFNEVVLPKILALKDDQLKEEGSKIVTRALFSKEGSETWTKYLKSVIELPEEEQKPKSTEMIENIMSKIALMSNQDQLQALKVIFKASLYSPCLSDQSKALLFCLFSNILQVCPTSEEVVKLTPLAFTFLPKFNMDLQERISCLWSFTKSLIEVKFDLTIQMLPSNETSTLLKLLQHLLKYLIDNDKKDSKSVSGMCLELGTFNPQCIEPLVGALSVSILSLPKEESDQMIDQLLTLYQKLRQLPKIVARLLITIGKGKIQPFELSQNMLGSFADKVTKIPLGQVIEIWKTFEYHLKNSKDDFTLEIVDQLMSTFALNACILEQSIPDATMEKITSLLETSSKLILDCGKAFPNLTKSLGEVNIRLNHSRGYEMIPALSKRLSNVQKRKAETIESSKIKKMKLSWDDIKSQPTKMWAFLLAELSEKELEIAIEECIAKSIDISEALQEDPRLQSAFLRNITKKLSNNSKFFKFLEKEDFTKASEHLEELPICDDKLLEALSKFPLEHLQGNIESSITLLLLSLYKANEKASTMLARSLFSGYRISSILKYLKVMEAIKILTREELNEKTKICLASIIKAGTIFQKPLQEILENLTQFSASLETLDNETSATISICLLESIHPVLTQKASTAEEKKAKCEAISKGLCKAFLKGLKSKSIDVESSLIKRGLTSVIDILCHQEEKKQLKKWETRINEYVSFNVSCRDITSLRFLSVILNNYAVVKESLGIDLLHNFLKCDLHRKPVETNDEIALLSLLLRTSSQNDLDLFSKLLDEMSEATLQSNDLQIFANWLALAKTKIDSEEAATIRKSSFSKILCLFFTNSKETNNEAFLTNFYWPMTKLHHALLESEKPILSKEAEALCLAQSISMVDLFQVNEQCGLASFEKCWNAMFNVISSAFHRRSSSLVITRIPLVLAGVRVLLLSLAFISDQKRQTGPSEMKAIVALSYNFERLCDHIRKLKDEFARVAPYLISDVMEAFQNFTLYPVIRSNIIHGVHKLLDICDTHSVDYLSSVLPSGKQEMFKHIYSNYKVYYKYAGRV